MTHSDHVVSLARIYYPVTTLGPGRRVGIWLCGCPRCCDGCISPELQRYDLDKEVQITDIKKMISGIAGPIDGFTISGGEPFLYPSALELLVRAMIPFSDDILIFTGYTLEELKAQHSDAVSSVLEMSAAIVDGPYMKEYNNGSGLRGSTNQTLWVFKYRERYAGIMDAGRKLQTVVYGGKVLTIGIP